MMRALMYAVGALVALAAATVQAQLNSDQVKCVSTVNKDVIKVLKEQDKLGVQCVAKASATAEACMDADESGKVQGKIAKALDHEADRCLDPPAFAYIGAGTAAAVARQTSKDVIRDVVGTPVEAGLLCGSDPAGCQCQIASIRRVTKMLDAAAMIFVKCKRSVLPFATSAADVADCVTNPANPLSIAADPKGKLAKRRGLLVATLQQDCKGLSSDPFLSGKCPGASGPTGADCLRDRVLCRACQLASGIDDLAIDCSAWLGSPCP